MNKNKEKIQILLHILLKLANLLNFINFIIKMKNIFIGYLKNIFIFLNLPKLIPTTV